VSVGDFAPKLVRLLFFTRDGESCFRCRRGLRWEERGFGWSMHHRKPRASGGTSNPVIGKASNAVTLCGSGTTGCHGWVESHRVEALEDGLLLSTNGRDVPVNVAVRRLDGSFWWLTDWGSAVEFDPEVVF
jgi:hypothetical protein